MRAGLAFALLTLVGCSFASTEALTPDNSCSNDASCEQGICRGGICIDDSGASVEVAIEVLRSASDTQGLTPESWAFAAESFSGASRSDLVLPATRKVRGVVRWNGLRVPATLRFVRRMSGPVAQLTPIAVEVDTLRETAADEGAEPYDFSTVLVAGEMYDVAVLPSSDMVVTPAQDSAPAIRSLPPLYRQLTVEEGDFEEPFLFDVTFSTDLTNECTLSLDTGCTLEAVVLSFDGEAEIPEAGLQVRAVDRESGLLVSSIGETDEYGRFTIRVSESAPDYWIRVTSSVGRAPFPAVSVDPEVAFADDPLEKRIYIPGISPVQLTGRVRDVNDIAVPGATVRFLSTAVFGGNQLGLQGTFSASATTTQDGSFGTELLPGYYSVTVTPPEDVENTWGILSTDVLVGEEITTTGTLVIPSQIELYGWVATFRDEHAVGITVLARARPSADSIAMPRSKEAVTNSLGAFVMSMDVGIYDVHVKVPSETGFAWLVDPELVMSAERGPLARTYELVPPIPIEGSVRTSDGDPVAGALVRAHVLSDVDGAAGRAVQVAETVSGEDGSYRLLIAPHDDE
jgi:hypothetical protein